MKTIRLAIALSALAIVTSCLGGTEHARQDRSTIAANQERLVLSRLQSALDYTGKAGRLYYLTSCDSNGSVLPFPEIHVQAPSGNKTGMADIHDMFEGDKNVLVTQDSSIIRIKIGKIPEAVLSTRISSFNLATVEQYNPSMVISAIFRSDEFKRATQTQRLQVPIVVIGGQVVEPHSGLPHMPSFVKEVTVDELLDMLAKTFEGIVVYETCGSQDGKGLVYIEFVHGYD